MQKFNVIFKHVYFKNIKSPTYLIMVLTPIIMLVISLGISKVITHANSPVKIAMVSDRPEDQALFQQLKGPDYQLEHSITTLQQAQQALQKKQIEGYLNLQTQNNTTQMIYYERKDSQKFSPDKLENQLNQLHLVQLAQASGVDAATIQRLTTPVVVNQTTVSFKAGKQQVDTSNQQQVAQILALGITILMFIFIVSYAGMVAQEIATEKGSRIMEIILSSVSATTQFFAKVAAILALLVTQIVGYLIVGVIALQYLKHQTEIAATVKQVAALTHSNALWYAILFLIIGVLLYTIVAAMLGSVVSRMDQVQQAISPIMLVGTASYLGGFALSTNPNIRFLNGLSYVPFFSQVMLPVRYANGNISGVAAMLGLLLAIVTLAGCTYLALAIYRMNVLVYSDKGVFKAFQRSISILRAEHRDSNDE